MAPSPSTEPARGTCAGFEIHSRLPFQTLRSGSGSALEVVEFDGPEPQGEVVTRWRARPDNPFHGSLLRMDGHYAFWASDAGWYRIDPARGTIGVSPGADPLLRELRLFGIPAAVVAMEAGDLSLHASAVEIGGRAVVLTGPSHHGKTTLAAALTAQGNRMLAEDTIRLRVGRDPAVFPGPALVRLRPDVAGRFEVPHATALAPLETGRTPLIFDEGARGSGDPVPLAGIAFLRTEEGPPRLEPSHGAAAVRDLFALAFRIPTSESRASCFEQITELVGQVGVVDLHRPMTIGSLEAVGELLSGWVHATDRPR